MIDRIGVHASHVRALARGLVADRELADDLAQDVLVAALEDGPNEGGARRAWLVAVLRHLASKAFRSRARRRDRERAAGTARVGVPSPAELLERADHSRWLVQHVLALDEPVRSVMRLRYLDDLPPREVARRLGLPVETVRTRAKRGVALLRERLERRHERDGGTWGLVLLGLGKPFVEPACVLSGAREFLVSPATVLLAMNLKKSVCAVSAVLVLAAVAWRVLPAGEPDTATAAAGASSALEPSARLDPRTATAPDSDTRTAVAHEPTPEPVAAPEVADATTGSLLLTVRWHDGAPAFGVNAQLFAHGSPDPERDSVRFRTGSEGTTLVESLPAGRVAVWLDRGKPQSTTIVAGEQAKLSVTLPRGVDLHGRVVSRAGTGVEGADVVVDTMGSGWNAFVMARSGPDGRFAIRSADEGLCWISARAALHAPSAQREVMAGGTETTGIDLVLSPTGAALEGIVYGSNGLAVAGAEVLVGPELSLESVQLDDGGRARVPAAQHAVCDEQGRYSIPGVPIGPIQLQARARGHAPWRGEAHVLEGRVWQEIRLAAPTSVTGRVTDDSGAPLTRAVVQGNGDHDFASSSARCDAEGRFTLSDMPAAEFDISASAEGYEPARTTLHGAAGATLAWDPVLRARPRIRGRLVSPGTDFSKWWVRCETLGSSSPSLSDAFAGADGAFVVEASGDVAHVLQVHAPGGSLHPVVTVTDVRPGPREVEIPISVELTRSGRVRGRILDDSHEPLGGAAYAVSREGDNTAPLFTAAADGNFETGGLVAGRYRVEVIDTRHVQLATEWIDLAPGATWDFGDLRLQRGGTILVRLERGAALAGAKSRVTAEALGRSFRLDVKGDEARSSLLAPGEYVVRLSDRGNESPIAERTARVTVEVGEAVAVDLPMQSALRLRLRFTPADHPPISARAFDAAGALLWERSIEPQAELLLSPDARRLVATDALGRTGTHDLQVAGSAPGSVVLIELR